MEHHEAVKLICEFGYEKKADEIIVMEMKHKTALCDFFVVMSAPSTVRVKTIAEHIEKSMKDEGHPTRHKEGLQEGSWVLLDYGDVIAHVFHQDTRKFYGIENLWGDVPKKSFFK